MEKYWNLIRSEAQFKDESHFKLSEGEWISFEPLVNEHCLHGLIWSAHAKELPAYLEKKWKVQWQSQWLRNHLYLQEWKQLQTLAKAAHLQVRALKGAALLPILYPDLGSRQMSDLDLLIASKQLLQFVQILKELGYQEKETLMWQANHFKSIWTIEKASYQLVIELHTQVFASDSNIDSKNIESQNIESKECFWQFEPTFSDRLSTSDQLIHLVGHLASQHTFLKLFWLIDIDRWVRKFEQQIDWERVFNGCTQLHMRKALVATLWAARTYLHTPIPQQIELNPTWIQRMLLSEKFLWRKNLNINYYILKWNLKDSTKDFLGYTWCWFVAHVRYRLKL